MAEIVVLDEAWPLPGMVERYRAAYLDEYAPGARNRGMNLIAAYLSPPLILKEGGNALHFLWSLPDVPAFWSARFADEPEKLAWWKRTAPLVSSRRRLYLRDYSGA